MRLLYRNVKHKYIYAGTYLIAELCTVTTRFRSECGQSRDWLPRTVFAQDRPIPGFRADRSAPAHRRLRQTPENRRHPEVMGSNPNEVEFFFKENTKIFALTGLTWFCSALLKSCASTCRFSANSWSSSTLSENYGEKHAINPKR